MKATESSKKDTIQHSNLIELLKTFTKEEIKEFDKFVRSPFHNNRNDVIRYFSIIKTFYPQFDQKNFTREHIFEELFPGEKFNDSAVRILGSKLLTSAENYIALRKVMKDEFLLKKNYMEDLIERKLEKLFLKTFSETENKLVDNPIRNSDYYLKKSQLESLKNESLHQLLHHKTKIISDHAKQILYFVDHFLISLLHGYLVIKNISTLYKSHEKIDIVEKLIHVLESSSIELNSVIRIYLMTYKVNDETENLDLFNKLREELVRENKRFNKSELRELYIILTNHCEERMVRGMAEYRKIKFGMFKEMLKCGLQLNERGEFLEYSFIRFVETGLLNKDFEWCENFIRQYGPMLKVTARENITNYAWGLLELMRNNFDKCLKHLAKTNFQDIIEKIQVKRLYIRCYYETKSFDEALSMIDSVKHTIGSKKDDDIKQLSENLRERYGNYFYYIEKMIKLNLGESKDDPDELQNKIKAVENIWDTVWLIRKIDEIKKNTVR